MKIRSILLAALPVLCIACVAGCDDGITPGAEMAPHPITPSGTPEQRIQRIESNPNLSAAQKQQYIAGIKQKNGMK